MPRLHSSRSLRRCGIASARSRLHPLLGSFPMSVDDLVVASHSAHQIPRLGQPPNVARLSIAQDKQLGVDVGVVVLGVDFLEGGLALKFLEFELSRRRVHHGLGQPLDLGLEAGVVLVGNIHPIFVLESVATDAADGLGNLEKVSLWFAHGWPPFLT